MAVGLSTRAFYRHFAGKDERILSMYRTDNGRVADRAGSPRSPSRIRGGGCRLGRRQPVRRLRQRT